MNTATVLTDFGLKDPYVGIMKGVMLSINPRLSIVDITHVVKPQDVREACFLIGEYYRYFSVGTVHLCVIDPTVGSARRALIAAKGDHLFVGPDNGLFSLLLDDQTRVYNITDSRFMLSPVSNTFHGRDVFAPAAAHLTLGVNPAEFGSLVTDPVRLGGLLPSARDNVMTGEVVRFDRFGNAISNISFELFSGFTADAPFLIEIGDLSFRSLSRSYYEGDYTCVVGSSGYLEFGLFSGNLGKEKNMRTRDRVVVRRASSP